MIIRPAKLEDMRACAAIFNRWVDETPWMPRVHDHDDVVRHYEASVFPTCDVRVAEREGKVCAFMALSADKFVSALYADRGSRSTGVGRRLLGAAKEEVPDQLRLWTFVANEGAQRFYAREGFVEVRRTDGDNEEGLPDILLQWSGRGAE